MKQTMSMVNISDSNSSGSTETEAAPTRGKRARTEPLLVRYKGIVPVHSGRGRGRWGAQICINHRRIWLGTFKSREAAAMAYDSATMKLRPDDTHRNFPWTLECIKERDFQSLHSRDVVIDMIKTGSYRWKLENFLKLQCARNVMEGIGPAELVVLQGEGRRLIWCKLLFQKVLTPSDVSKLNRLVVPKREALKHLPRIVKETGEGSRILQVESNENVDVVFYDRSMNQWKFRYCFWPSSQSFVLSSGWRDYVEENGLKAHDILCFYRAEATDPANGKNGFYMIDVYRNEIQLPCRGATGLWDVSGNKAWIGGASLETVKETAAVPGKPKGVKLFGVQIG